MSDLIERLRDPSSVRSWADADKQRAEAAAELERLRADAALVRAHALEEAYWACSRSEEGGECAAILALARAEPQSPPTSPGSTGSAG